MTAPKIPDRGNYRGVFEALVDDLDYQNLAPLSQTVFWTLKLKLGQYGIGVFYLATLPEIHRRASRRKLDDAITELEAPKPNSRPGWIRRERNIVWIVNGLRAEPSITLANKNHRLGALRYARALPAEPIVAQFIAYYDLENDDWMGLPSHPDPIGIPGGITETEKKTDTETETETTSSSPLEVIGTESAIADVLVSDADRNALTALLASVPHPTTWLAEMAASLNKMTGHVGLTPLQLGLAMRDFLGNGATEDPNLSHFRAYLRRAAQPVRGGRGERKKPQRYDYPSNGEDVQWPK